MDTRAALLAPQICYCLPPENSPLELKVTLQKERERSCWGLAHFQLSEEKHETTSVSPGSPQLGQWLCSSFVLLPWKSKYFSVPPLLCASVDEAE